MPSDQYGTGATKSSNLSDEEMASLGSMALNLPESAVDTSPFGASDPVDNNPPF